MPFQKGHTLSRGRPVSEAGRFKQEIAAARAHMGAAIEPVSHALVDKALGLYVVQIRARNGKWIVPTEQQLADAIAAGEEWIRAYRQEPDLAAIGMVFDRIMGKVPTPIDIEVRQVIENATADQDTIARILQEHVPAEYLEPVLGELRRVREHRRRAVAVLSAAAAP